MCVCVYVCARLCTGTCTHTHAAPTPGPLAHLPVKHLEGSNHGHTFWPARCHARVCAAQNAHSHTHKHTHTLAHIPFDLLAATHVCAQRANGVCSTDNHFISEASNSAASHSTLRVHVYVCVCVRERERESERDQRVRCRCSSTLTVRSHNIRHDAWSFLPSWPFLPFFTRFDAFGSCWG